MRATAGLRLEELAVVFVFLFFGVAGAIPGIAPNQANEMTGATATTLQTAAGIGSQLLVNATIVILLFRARRRLFSFRHLFRHTVDVSLEHETGPQVEGRSFLSTHGGRCGRCGYSDGGLRRPGATTRP